MAFHTFGPGMALDKITQEGLATVTAKVEDADTGEALQAYTLEDPPEPILLTTNRRGYFGEFRALDTARRVRLNFGNLALDQIAHEIITDAATAVEEVGAFTALYAGQVAEQETRVGNVSDRLDSVEVLAGLAPGDTSDATVKSHIINPASDTAAAINTAIVDEAGIVTVSLSSTVGAANVTTIENAIIAHPTKEIRIPMGSWPVSRKILVNRGVKIRGEGLNSTELVINVFGQPIFDVLDATKPPVIQDMHLRCSAAKSLVAGSIRGGSATSFAAGVWTNTSRTSATRLKTTGFSAGVLAINWNTASAARVGHIEDVTIGDIESDGCDWGILAAGFRRLNLVGKIAGTYTLRPGSSDPSHLVYISENSQAGQVNEDLVLEQVDAWDGTGGHAVQIKGVIGVSVGTIRARRCHGVFSYADMTDANIGTIRSLQDKMVGAYSVYGQAGNADVDIDLISLDMSTDEAAIRLESTRGTVGKVALKTNHAANSSVADVILFGDGITVGDIAVRSEGAGAWRGVEVAAGKHHIKGLAHDKAAIGAIVSSGAADGNRIDLDPAQVVMADPASGRVVSVTGKPSTLVRLRPNRTTVTVGAAGQNVNTRADQFTTVAVSIIGTVGFSFINPVEPLLGATITYEITNTTGLEEVSNGWGTSYKFGTAGPMLTFAANSTRSITFTYNGTAWIEVART